MCVSKCPKIDFNLEREYKNQNGSDINAIREKMICVQQYNKSSIYSIKEARLAVSNQKCTGEIQASKSCESFFLFRFRFLMI